LIVGKRLLGRFLVFCAGALWLVGMTLVALSQQAPAGAGGDGAAGRGGGRGGRGRGGAPNPLLSQPAPKLPDGTVNFGREAGEKGIWNLPYITNMGARNIVVDAPKAPAPAPGAAPQGRGGGGGGGGQRGGAPSEPWVPFKPWAAAVYNYHSMNETKYDPESMCTPPGGPRMFATPYPMEIIQIPSEKRIFVVYEGGTHVWREIYMDGRPHPGARSFDGSHLWMGHSVGYYEDNGQTLVVDITGFNEGTTLDYFGHPHTEQLHVVERYTRPNKGTLHYEALIDDPGAYTKPWKVAWDIPWNASGELIEYICQGNNQYLNHLKDDFGEPVLLRQQ
jgi:hypothetical protein